MTPSRGASLDVLVLVREFPPRIGGRSSLFRELARHFPATRTSISTPFVRGAGSVDRKLPCRILRALCFGDPSRGFGRRLWTSHVKRAVSARRPDLVLAGGLVPEGLLALELKRTMDIPYLLHLEAPQIVRLRQGGSAPEIGDALLREVVTGSNGILVGSQACWFEAYRLGIYPHDLQKVSVAVDLDRFRPGPKPEALARRLRAGEGPVLLTVTGQAPVDEMATLLRAFSTLRDTERRAVFVVVGREQDAAVSKLAAELGVADSIRLLRSVPDAEMPDLFRLADVFVLAGREDREHGLLDGIQFAALEALASGVPVVGSRTRTAEELIPDPEAGILVEPESPGKLARALLEVLRSRRESNALSSAAREHAERHLDARRAATELRELLEVVYFRRMRRGTLAPAGDPSIEALAHAV